MDISKIRLENETYNIKDETARQEIYNLKNKNEILLGYSFTSGGSTYASHNYLTISYDNVVYKVHDITELKNVVRDGSICYNPDRKEFYLITEYDGTDKSITVYTSKNLIKWDKKDILINGYQAGGHLWAPQLFYLKNELILSFSYSEDNNKTHFIVVGTSMDFDDFTFENCHKITMTNTNFTSFIDPSITYLNDKFYATFKSETKVIQLFTSNDLINFNCINVNVLNHNDENDSSTGMESEQIYVYNNKLNITAYCYDTHYRTFLGISEDKINFKWYETNLKNENYIGNKCIVLNDDYSKAVVNNLKFDDPIKTTIEKLITLPSSRYPSNREYSIIPGINFRITSDTIITNLRTPFDQKNTLIMLNDNERQAKLTINETESSKGPYIIKNSYSNNYQYIKFTSLDGSGFENSDAIYDELITSEILLNNAFNVTLTNAKGIKRGNIFNFIINFTANSDLILSNSNSLYINPIKFRPLFNNNIITNSTNVTGYATNDGDIKLNGTIHSGEKITISGCYITK